MAWRNNTTGVYDPTKGAFRKLASLKGVSDILGVLIGSGRFLAVEVKRPGIKAIDIRPGVLSPEQRMFLEAVNAAGGVGIWVDDVRTLQRVLDVLARDPGAKFDIKGGLIDGRQG